MLPPVEPRSALEMPTGLFAGSIEKIKATKWMLVAFMVLVAGIYFYEQKSQKWLELDELKKKSQDKFAKRLGR